MKHWNGMVKGLESGHVNAEGKFAITKRLVVQKTALLQRSANNPRVVPLNQSLPVDWICFDLSGGC